MPKTRRTGTTIISDVAVRADLRSAAAALQRERHGTVGCGRAQFRYSTRPCHIMPIGMPMGPTMMLSAVFFWSSLSTP